MFIFKDPCKKCIVQAMCNTACDEMIRYRIASPYLDIGLILAKTCFIISVIFAIYITVKRIFPILDCDIYTLIHWLIGTAIGGYIMTKNVRREYKEDQERLFR